MNPSYDPVGRLVTSLKRYLLTCCAEKVVRRATRVVIFLAEKRKERGVKRKEREARELHRSSGLMDVLYDTLSKNVSQYLNEEIQPILCGVENKKPPTAHLSKAKSFCDGMNYVILIRSHTRVTADQQHLPTRYESHNTYVTLKGS